MKRPTCSTSTSLSLSLPVRSSSQFSINQCLPLDRLHHSARLLDDSFDPTTPPAPVSFVGPPRHAPVPFSTLLAQRWNHAISSATTSVRETDFLAVSASLAVAGKELVGRLGSEMKGSASDVQKGKVGRDVGGLEGGVAMDRLPGRVSPDVSGSAGAGGDEAVRGAKEVGEGAKDEFKRLQAELRGEAQGKKVMEGMTGTKRLV